jgi:CRP-like cAMP-binding protein
MPDDITAKIETFFAVYRERKYKHGHILILNNDTCEYVYYLTEGKVKQYDVSYRGDEIILNVFKPPAFFPMSLAINKVSNPYIYEAETDIIVRQAPADAVVAFIQEQPDVMFNLLSRLYRGTDGVLGRMVHLMAGSAKSRLVYELLLEAARFGTSDGTDTHLTINEREIGARAGLTRETVSRELRDLKAAKLISVTGKGIVIHDIKELRHKIGHDA